jgi:hypothetical protein
VESHDKEFARLPLSQLTLDAVQATAYNARMKHGEKALTNPDMPAGEKLAVLVEEVGEVGRAMTYDADQGVVPLVHELLQVAAVALSWVEALDGEPYPVE